MPDCRSCGEAIIFARTLGSKLAPLDADPLRAGDCALTDLVGVLENGVVDFKRAGALAPDTEVYVSHFVTCPCADQHRRAR